MKTRYFHYMASKGEIRVNQAKRGYDVTEDAGGLSWYNPYVSPFPPRPPLLSPSLLP